MAAGSIEFNARYRGWRLSKRIEVGDGATLISVLPELVSVRQAISDETLEVLGIDVKALDSYAAGITKGKGYAAAGETIKKLGSKETKEAVLRACKGKEELSGIASSRLLRKVAEITGLPSEGSLRTA
jgi:hypothetical protein